MQQFLEKKSDTTKMNAHNLAIAVGPSVFPFKFESRLLEEKKISVSAAFEIPVALLKFVLTKCHIDVVADMQPRRVRDSSRRDNDSSIIALSDLVLSFGF